MCFETFDVLGPPRNFDVKINDVPVPDCSRHKRKETEEERRERKERERRERKERERREKEAMANDVKEEEPEPMDEENGAGGHDNEPMEAESEEEKPAVRDGLLWLL